MPIYRFSDGEFEEALPRHKSGLPEWVREGVIGNELCYRVSLIDRDSKGRGRVTARVHSSINPSSLLADDTGENSIRFVLLGENDQVLTNKTNAWTKRVSGWEKRVIKKLKEMHFLAFYVDLCPKCGNQRGVYTVSKGDNKGRIFRNCIPCKDKRLFQWITDIDGNVMVNTNES